MIYFDNASSTKPIKECLDTFYNESLNNYFNPSSIHEGAMHLSANINRIKANFLKCLKLDDKYEVIFTSGASESNNLAIIGYALKNRNRGNKLITSKVEHESVLNVFHYLETLGFLVTYLDVNKEGKIDLETFKKTIDKDTILVSLMPVNNEVGFILNIKEISEIIKMYPKCVLHCDAAQTLGKERFDYQLADLITISAHKIYGIKGIGALIKKKKISLMPLIHGGGQENGLRSGTLDYPAIASFNVSLNYITANFENFYKKTLVLQDYLLKELSKIDEIVINTSKNSSPYIVNFSFKTKKASVIVEALSNRGIYCSSVSACNSKKEESSYVLKAIGRSEKEAHNSLRISLSKDNTFEECEEFIKILKELIVTIRG